MKLKLKLLRKLRKQYILNKRRKFWQEDFKNRFTEEDADKKQLSNEQIKEIKRYYSRFSKKIKINPLFHNFYYAKTSKYFKNYIPEDIYYSYIDPYFNDWRAAKYLDNKCFYYRMFPSVKQPEAVVFRVNNIWLDDKMNIINHEELQKIISKQNSLVIKRATGSEGGKDIYFFEKGDKNFDELCTKISGDVVVQKKLIQSTELSKVNKTSVNTIRILSLLHDNKVTIYSSILRMGINGSKVDNASNGGITCGINKDGRLKNIAYSINGKAFGSHPTSGIKFSDVVIPNYESIKQIVYSLHPTVSMFKLISWDIALDKNNNPMLIEANFHYGELDFHQLNNGPLFGKDTDKILKEVFKNIDKK